MKTYAIKLFDRQYGFRFISKIEDVSRWGIRKGIIYLGRVDILLGRHIVYW